MRLGPRQLGKNGGSDVGLKQMWPEGTPDPNDNSVQAQSPTLNGTGDLRIIRRPAGRLVELKPESGPLLSFRPLQSRMQPGIQHFDNPFANQFQDCQLSCAGVSTDNSVLNSHASIVDEIRGFGPAPYTSFNDPNRVDLNVPDANGVFYGESGYSSLYATNYQSWEVAALMMQRYPVEPHPRSVFCSLTTGMKAWATSCMTARNLEPTLIPGMSCQRILLLTKPQHGRK